MLNYVRYPRPLLTIRPYSTNRRFPQAPILQYDAVNRPHGFNAEEPAIFKQSFLDKLPAIEKWFTRLSPASSTRKLENNYLDPFGASIVPLEVTQTSNDNHTTFDRIEAPLSLLLAHMATPDASHTRLYLAQHSLDDLPTEMRADLPTPELLSILGRGDIYASSLWMGKPPTRTPLHRDPNPNLFVQIAGEKVVRLMAPNVGRAVYEGVRARVGKHGGRANMRGAEMMEGEEMQALEEAVWGDGEGGNDGGLEARLGCGDGLYIPLGWWHAVRSVGDGANASVNWWFR